MHIKAITRTTPAKALHVQVFLDIIFRVIGLAFRLEELLDFQFRDFFKGD